MNGEPGLFEPGAQLFEPVQPLSSLVLAMPPTSPDADLLYQSRRIECQRVGNRDDNAIAFLVFRIAEVVEYKASIYHLQRQPPTSGQHSGALPQNRFVLVFRIEKAEGIHHDGAICAFGSKWKAPHVPANPTGVNARFLGELSCSMQQGNGKVEAEDLGATFGEGERMSPMTTPNVNHARCRRQLEQIPERPGLQSHVI